jgi:hypothetical protein
MPLCACKLYCRRFDILIVLIVKGNKIIFLIKIFYFYLKGIWDLMSHGCYYDDCCLLGCDAVYVEFDISKSGCLHLQDLWNTSNYLPDYTVSHRRKRQPCLKYFSILRIGSTNKGFVTPFSVRSAINFVTLFSYLQWMNIRVRSYLNLKMKTNRLGNYLYFIPIHLLPAAESMS